MRASPLLVLVALIVAAWVALPLDSLAAGLVMPVLLAAAIAVMFRAKAVAASLGAVLVGLVLLTMFWPAIVNDIRAAIHGFAVPSEVWVWAAVGAGLMLLLVVLRGVLEVWARTPARRPVRRATVQRSRVERPDTTPIAPWLDVDTTASADPDELDLFSSDRGSQR